MEAAPQDVKTRTKDPRKQARFWAEEIKASQKMLEKCHKQGTRVVKRYVDDRGFSDANDTDSLLSSSGQFRLNLFNSNITTLQDMLYSTLPRVETNRTNADANDDVARVASVMIERIINLDIDDNGQTYDSMLRSSLQDRLLPGLGCARVRYEVETSQVEVPAQTTPDGRVIAPAYSTEQVTFEDAPAEYYHWQDVLWGWGRNFSDLPWIAFRSWLSKEQVSERFGKEFADQVTYKTQKEYEDNSDSAKENDSPWKKAEIWEIWDKETKNVVWWSKDCLKLLDSRPDPLQLTQFFPCPPFLMANPTTSLYRPTSDFHIAQDLYNEVDTLQTRIAIITSAVKVVGVYDSSSEGVKRMMQEGFDNDLIPVDSWALFAETGGIKGAIDWLPIEAVVSALAQLVQLRDQTILLLQSITGMSDVMQGGLQNEYEGVGQTQIKAQFGSVRVQALQDQFAEFTGNLLQLKAEVICRHFQPETIARLANMQFSPDQELIQPAIQLLKDPEMARIRLKVRPESISMIDYAKLKQDRTDWLNAFSTFMQSAAPMLESQPDALPVMLEMLQWTMAGFRGSNEIEGVLDRAIDAAKAKAEQPQEDPAAAEAAQQAQQDQAKHQREMEKIQAKAQADVMVRQADLQGDIHTLSATSQAKQAEIISGHQATMAEIQGKLKADMVREQIKMQANIQQTTAGAEAEMVKDENQAALDIEKLFAETRIELEAESEKATNAMRTAALGSAHKLDEMAAQSLLKRQEKAQEQENEDEDENE